MSEPRRPRKNFSVLIFSVSQFGSKLLWKNYKAVEKNRTSCTTAPGIDKKTFAKENMMIFSQHR